MRFVDEFRDADTAHALAAKITALCEPGRQYKLMEVCGGHTHTIYKHGLAQRGDLRSERVRRVRVTEFVDESHSRPLFDP